MAAKYVPLATHQSLVVSIVMDHKTTLLAQHAHLDSFYGQIYVVLAVNGYPIVHLMDATLLLI